MILCFRWKLRSASFPPHNKCTLEAPRRNACTRHNMTCIFLKKIKKTVKYITVNPESFVSIGYFFPSQKNPRKNRFFEASKAESLLNWWKLNVVIGSNPIRSQIYCIEIFAESFLSGWGCYCNGKNHINYSELLAAFFSMNCFSSKRAEYEALLQLDNSTAIPYINRAGGVGYPYLSELARKIWEWCKERKICLRASYIRSAKNIKANRASRNINSNSKQF